MADFKTGRLCLTAIALAAVGCQTTTEKVGLATTPAELPPRAVTADTPGAAMTADEAVDSDASAARLHDVEGALLTYYLARRSLPATLDELKPLAPELTLTAPSGRPYLYDPAGRSAMGTTKRIIVADPAPSAAGVRWCIFMPPPANPSAAVSMEVMAVAEPVFREYRK